MWLFNFCNVTDCYFFEYVQLQVASLILYIFPLAKQEFPPRLQNIESKQVIAFIFFFIMFIFTDMNKIKCGHAQVSMPKINIQCQKPPVSTLAMHHLSGFVHSKKKIVHCLTYFRKSKSMSYSNLGRKQPIIFLWIDLVFYLLVQSKLLHFIDKWFALIHALHYFAKKLN